MKKTLLLLFFPCFLCAQSIELDPSFGDDGHMTYGHPDSVYYLNGLDLLDNDKILLAGYVFGWDYYNFYQGMYVLKTNEDGSADTQFAGDGWFNSSFGTNGDIAYGARELPDGKTMVLGYVADFITFENVLIRLNPDGSVDDSFGDEGQLEIEVPDEDGAFAQHIEVDADGNTYVIGYYGSNGFFSYAGFIGKITPDGEYDTSFGTEGFIKIDDVDITYFPYHISILDDGRIVFVSLKYKTGFVSYYPEIQVFNADGSRDTDFGESGRLLLLTEYLSASSSAAHVDEDGNIFVLCEVYDLTSPAFRGVVKVLPNGDYDPTFGDEGLYTEDINYDSQVFTDIVNKENILYVVGANYSIGEIFLLRLKANGTPDTDLSTDGKVYFELDPDLDEQAPRIESYSDDRLLVGGFGQDPNFNSKVFLARFNTDFPSDTGEPPVLESMANVFPNPASEYFTVQLEIAEEMDLDCRLYDSLGRLIADFGRQTFLSSKSEIQFSVPDNLPSGHFFLELRSEKIYLNVPVQIE